MGNAVTEQLRQVQHTSNLFYTMPDALLAERLCRETGYAKVFFGNSGAEANEGAIKDAGKYGREKKGENCNQIITLKNSFHGRTVTTLAATGQDSFPQYFFPFTGGFRYVEADNRRQLQEAVDNSACGIMVELVQGEGGAAAIDKGYAKYVEEVCKENDILFPVDEVQTGIGRKAYIVKARMQLMRDFGVYPAAHSAFLLNLGLETLAVRMKQYCENDDALLQMKDILTEQGFLMKGCPLNRAGMKSVSVVGRVCGFARKRLFARKNHAGQKGNFALLAVPALRSVLREREIIIVIFYEQVRADLEKLCAEYRIPETFYVEEAVL